MQEFSPGEMPGELIKLAGRVLCSQGILIFKCLTLVFQRVIK